MALEARIRELDRVLCSRYTTGPKGSVRNDREFFRLDFFEASKITHEIIVGSGLEVRTLNALAALGAVS